MLIFEMMSSDSVRVSVVMPVYNGGAFLREAVASVLSQRDANFELLIRDDGSNDGSAEFLDTLRDNPRVKLWSRGENLGIFGNLNFLVSHAAGDIVKILCQDDFFTHDAALQELLGLWANLGDDVAFLRTGHGSDGGSRLNAAELDVLPAIVPSAASSTCFFVFGCIPGNLSNISFRSWVPRMFGAFDQGLPYAGDFDFWSRVGRQRPWALSRVQNVMVRRHEGQASVTLNKHGELLRQLDVVLSRLYADIRPQGFQRFLLRWMASLHYMALHREMALRFYQTTRNAHYMGELRRWFADRPYSFGWVADWLIYGVSLGGRLPRAGLAKLIVRGCLKRQPSA